MDSWESSGCSCLGIFSIADLLSSRKIRAYRCCYGYRMLGSITRFGVRQAPPPQLHTVLYTRIIGRMSCSMPMAQVRIGVYMELLIFTAPADCGHHQIFMSYINLVNNLQPVKCERSNLHTEVPCYQGSKPVSAATSPAMC